MKEILSNFLETFPTFPKLDLLEEIDDGILIHE